MEGKNACSIHGKPLKFFCNNIGCFSGICEDCWIIDHVHHHVVPSKIVLGKDVEELENNWKKIEDYQTTCRKLVTDSVNLSEDTLSIMQKIDQLILSKGDLRKFQSVEDNHLFKQKTLKELEKHEELVERIKQKTTSLIASYNQVENSLNAAKDCFREGPASSSFPAVGEIYLRRSNCKLKDIKRRIANGKIKRFGHYAFCPRSQNLFFADKPSFSFTPNKMFRVSIDSIQKETEFDIPGNIMFDTENFDFS